MSEKNIDVKYSNDLNIPLIDFKASEMDLLMTICSFLKSRGIDEIKFSFAQIRQSAGLGAISNDRLIQLLKDLSAKIVGIMPFIEDDARFTRISLFPVFDIDKDARAVTIAVNPKYEYLLNGFKCNWTGFELLAFTTLNSRYSKSLFRYLKQWKTIGRYTVSLEEFKRNLDVPSKYSSKKIDQKILQPCLKELKTEFVGLKVEKQYKSTGKRGRSVLSGYVFSFQAQKPEDMSEEKKYDRAIVRSGGEKSKLICPYCKRNLMEKRINGSISWAHPDFKTGPCSVIFNDVAEIHAVAKRMKDKEERKNRTQEQEDNIRKIHAMTDMFKSDY